MNKIIIFSDGGARDNPGPAGVGAVLLNPVGAEVATVSKFLGNATNNQAEYVAAGLGLKKALDLGATEVEIFLDSKLVVEQLNGRWKIKDLELKKLAEKIHTLLVKLEKWEISHVPRAQNKRADALANQAMDANGFKKKLFFPGSRFH